MEKEDRKITSCIIPRGDDAGRGAAPPLAWSQPLPVDRMKATQDGTIAKAYAIHAAALLR
jgi:hypothetical protein